MRSPFKTYQWSSQIFACQSNDLEHLKGMFDEEITRLGMGKYVLGTVTDDEISLFQSPKKHAHLPSVLICAGFHGEESAANWGILYFLNQLNEDIFNKINISVLPLVNSTGFRKGYHCNKQGENPNIGFEFINGRPCAGNNIAAEGRILLKNAQLLQSASKSGVLSCHENVLQNNAYIHSFEPRSTPGKFSLELRNKMTEFFPLAEESVMGGYSLDNGIIFNHFTPRFEAFLVKAGARVGFCVETPGQQDFDQRILAHKALINRFVQLIIDETNTELG